jgi:hypothetical protein
LADTCFRHQIDSDQKKEGFPAEAFLITKPLHTSVHINDGQRIVRTVPHRIEFPIHRLEEFNPQ